MYSEKVTCHKLSANCVPNAFARDAFGHAYLILISLPLQPPERRSHERHDYAVVSVFGNDFRVLTADWHRQGSMLRRTVAD